MGAWGTGLYADDFAADLRPAVRALCRVPMSGAEIVATLSDIEPAASDREDPDHTTFWLVVGGELHRLGIPSPARERAIGVIDDGSNLAVLASLEMSESDLIKRASILQDLRSRLQAPLPEKPRRTLAKPERIILGVGETFAFPIDHQGNVRNPYFPENFVFHGVAWGSCVVLATGHAVEYLAWYQIAPGRRPSPTPPDISEALRMVDTKNSRPCTLTTVHKKRMMLEGLGTTQIGTVLPPSSGDVLHAVATSVSAADVISLNLPMWSVDGCCVTSPSQQSRA